MNHPVIFFASVLLLAACKVPPIEAETVTLPTVVVTETTLKPAPPRVKVPAIKPTPVEVAPTKTPADVRCPPTEGETEQQRIIRKLDCLLERD